MTSKTVAMSGLPATSTTIGSPGVAVVSDAGLVMEMPVATVLLAAPSVLARRSRGQKDGVVYPS